MKKKKLSSITVIAIAESLVILLLVMFFAWYAFIYHCDDFSVKKAVTASTENEEPQVRRRAVIEKEETIYQLDGEKILMNDSTYGEVFMPVFKDVPKSTVDTDSVVTRNGYSFYKQKGKVTSIAGIDISEHQGEIDWQQVKDAGIEFAFIRVGCRTYGGGEIVFDERFAENLAKADEVGIKTGVYFFSQALTPDEAIEEADAVIDAISPYNITYPVVFDWEIIYDDSARTDKISVNDLADCCVSFCERVESAGYKPMIYQNKGTAMCKLDLPKLTKYDFWLAEYGDKPTYYYEYKIWQYASDGKVPGIEGDVDLNIAFADCSQ